MMINLSRHMGSWIFSTQFANDEEKKSFAKDWRHANALGMLREFIAANRGRKAGDKTKFPLRMVEA